MKTETLDYQTSQKTKNRAEKRARYFETGNILSPAERIKPYEISQLKTRKRHVPLLATQVLGRRRREY